MKIALLGYGKMGKAIEQIAIERGHEIVARVNDAQDDKEGIRNADVAIEFTAPLYAIENIKMCFERNVPVVVGTTGWYEKYEEISAECSEKEQCMFTATNFSLGVNVFFKLNEYLAKMMDNFPDYEVSMSETHHTEKLDAPSGTAITLAEGILDNVYRKNDWISIVEGNTEEKESFQLPITSFRKNEVPGTHEITYSSVIDDIEIKHTAHNRKGFAMGAVFAAEFIKGKKGIYGMNDMLNI